VPWLLVEEYIEQGSYSGMLMGGILLKEEGR
jgi:hypothetical protein